MSRRVPARVKFLRYAGNGALRFRVIAADTRPVGDANQQMIASIPRHGASGANRRRKMQVSKIVSLDGPQPFDSRSLAAPGNGGVQVGPAIF